MNEQTERLEGILEPVPAQNGPWEPIPGFDPWRTRTEYGWLAGPDKAVILYLDRIQAAYVHGAVFVRGSRGIGDEIPLPVLQTLLHRAELPDAEFLSVDSCSNCPFFVDTGWCQLAKSHTGDDQQIASFCPLKKKAVAVRLRGNNDPGVVEAICDTKPAPLQPTAPPHRKFVEIGVALVDPARVVAIERGKWNGCENVHDWLAILVLDAGARVETGVCCKEATALLTGGGE
jgi:hypothetical protein